MSEEDVKDKLPLGINIVTWVIRILTGALFIFSGFTKSIDIWGTIFKIEDYLNVIGFPISGYLIAFISFILCIVEFLLGALLLLGCFRKSVPVLLAIIMGFMLPLTLWIAIFNPVPDCGCFGEALLISNWATFFKNVVLTAFVIWLIIFNNRVRWIIMPSIQWIFFVASILFIFIISFIGFADQPLIDFRDYKVGTKLISDSETESFEPEYVFIYEKDGKRKEFSQDEEMPDEEDGWKFIDRREVEIKENKKKDDSNDLFLYDFENNTDEDISNILDPDSPAFILLYPSLENLSLASSYKINSIKEWADQNDVDLIAITGSSEKAIENWKDVSMAKYPIYGLEDTKIKIIARGNPAIIYLEEGEIKWKHALRALPVEPFIDENKTLDPLRLEQLSPIRLWPLTMVYLIVTGFLTLLSLIPSLRSFFPIKKEESKIRHDDKAHSEE